MARTSTGRGSWEILEELIQMYLNLYLEDKVFVDGSGDDTNTKRDQIEVSNTNPNVQPKLST